MPSDSLFQLFEERGIEIEHVNWDGKIDSLPTNENVLVRPSSKLTFSWESLAEFCEAHGHLCFYDGLLVTSNGSVPLKENINEVKQFLDSGLR